MPGKIARALQTGSAWALYSGPWFIARTFTLARRALRFSADVIRLGWKDGMHESA